MPAAARQAAGRERATGSRSVAARWRSRARRSRTASSRAAAAPERRIRISGSGSISGSSHGPCTTNGSSKVVAAVRCGGADQARDAFEIEIAGGDGGRCRRVRVSPPRLRASWSRRRRFRSRSCSDTAILSNGVRPLRNSLPPDSGRRSSRRNSCSRLIPVSAPLPPDQGRGAVERAGQSQHVARRCRRGEGKVAFAFQSVQRRTVPPRSLIQIDVRRIAAAT